MNNYSRIMLKSEDVFQLISKLVEIGWKSIRESSINRIIYLSAVLYSFRYPNEKNIFEDDYNFSVTLSGPEDPEVEEALINLQSNEVIERTDYGYVLGIEKNNSFSTVREKKRKSGLMILHILLESMVRIKYLILYIEIRNIECHWMEIQHTILI